MLSIDYVVVFVVALIVVLALTPFIRNFAIRRHFFDHPDDRKVHKTPVPLLGGISAFIGFTLAAIAGILWCDLAITRMVVGLFLGSVILVLLGIIDDRRGMSPVVKLFGQIVAAGVMVFCGCKAMLIPTDVFSIAVSLFWIVGLTNALNLLDNMDGITGGVGLIAAGAFFVLGALQHDGVSAMLAVALAGAALGYLWYNLPPATIFLGDAGSMLIGFVLASLGLMITNGQFSPVGLLVPLLIMIYPIFDTTLVTITRIADRRNVTRGGKDHSTHRIRTLVGSDALTALIVYAINTILVGGAVFLFHAPTLSNAVVTGAAAGVGLGYLGWKLSRVPVDVRRMRPVSPPEISSASPALVTNPDEKRLDLAHEAQPVSP